MVFVTSGATLDLPKSKTGWRNDEMTGVDDKS